MPRASVGRGGRNVDTRGGAAVSFKLLSLAAITQGVHACKDASDAVAPLEPRVHVPLVSAEASRHH